GRRREAESFLKNDFGATFVDSDCSGDKCERKVDDFRERLDDVSLRPLRLKTQDLQREINLDDARRVRRQVASDHHEERRRVVLVEVVNFRHKMIDVMASLEYD